MATLFGTKIQDTYDGLLKVTDNIGITGTKKFITDGLGVNSSVKISSLDFEVANFFFIDVLSGQDPSNYKVGINTSSPTQMLHVVGNMRLTGAFYDSNNATGTSGQILSSTTSGTDWVDITAIQTLSGSGTTNYLTKWTNNTVLGNSILYETSSKIGIGTITPSEKLHVDGNVAVDGELHLLSSNEVYGIIKPENSIIKFYAGDGISATGTPDVIITGDGNSRLGVNVASPDEALHVVGDALITGDSHADAFKPAVTANPIKFKNFASTELMRITDTGLVGIANNSPSYTLDVTGTARVSGDTYFVTQANSDDSNKVATTAYVKNLIEEIPAGLIFQGTWNASTNTPTLTSGSGTTGHFYIVSTDGSTNLDGITDWKVGDWAVFVEQGVTDQWEKIDNSSVLDGSGTGQKVTLWSGSGTSNTLTDAPITVDGNDVKITSSGDTNLILQSASPGSTSLDFYEGTAEKAHVTFDTVNNVLTMGRASGGLSIDNSGNTTFAGDITLGANHIGRDDDNYIGFQSDDLIKFRVAGATQVKISDGVFTPQTDSDIDLGSSGVRFKELWVDSINGGSVVPGSYLPLSGGTMTGTNGVAFPDDFFLYLGTSSDLRIYHNSTNGSNIWNTVGNLTIQNTADNQDILFKNDNGAGGNAIYFYLDGSLTNGTTTLGATRFPDNSKIFMGTGGDLVFNHDGTNSFIDNLTGDFTIENAGDDLILKSADDFLVYVQGTDIAIQATGDGKVGLRYNNVEKLETTNTGVTVTGSSNRFSVDLTTASAIDIGYYSSVRTIRAVETGGNNLRPLAILSQNFSVDSTGSATFVGAVGIGLTNPTVPLDVEGKIRSNDSNSGDYIEIFCDGSVSGDSYIENTNNNIQIKSAFATSFSTSGSVAMFINNSQKVGIGTTLPKTSLDIVKNSDIWHLMVGGLTKKLLVGGQAASGDVVLQAGAASTANNAAVTTAYNLCLQRDGGNVGVGNANPQSKLQVAGGIQMANDTDTASASKVGTLKYYTSGNNSYVDMCMQTGATTYEWINIVQNNW
jgi:hypothetical protein